MRNKDLLPRVKGGLYRDMVECIVPDHAAPSCDTWNSDCGARASKKQGTDPR